MVPYRITWSFLPTRPGTLQFRQVGMESLCWLTETSIASIGLDNWFILQV